MPVPISTAYVRDSEIEKILGRHQDVLISNLQNAERGKPMIDNVSRVSVVTTPTTDLGDYMTIDPQRCSKAARLYKQRCASSSAKDLNRLRIQLSQHLLPIRTELIHGIEK